jgi:hypothetical protein
VVDVPNRSHVHVRLTAFEFLLRHRWLSSSESRVSCVVSFALVCYFSHTAIQITAAF